jgi:hypothetical protein
MREKLDTVPHILNTCTTYTKVVMFMLHSITSLYRLLRKLDRLQNRSGRFEEEETSSTDREATQGSSVFTFSLVMQWL